MKEILKWLADYICGHKIVHVNDNPQWGNGFIKVYRWYRNIITIIPHSEECPYNVADEMMEEYNITRFIDKEYN